MKRILPSALRATQIIFALFLIFFAIRLLLYHYHLVIFPYPNTLREGAMMTSTQALVQGLNPYDMSLQPRWMNQYGIIYPLLVWPWAKLWGTTILIHRLVIAFFLLASCLLMFFVLKRTKVPVLLNIWAVLMLYSSFLYPGTSTPTIDPGIVGIFFFLLTLFIPWFCKYSYPSLMISVICGLLAFYTKTYTFLGVLFMLSYLFLFISKIKSIFYGFSLFVLSTISIVLVNSVLPAYFDNCFFSHINMEHSWASMERLHVQMVMYKDLHEPIFILLGLFILGFGFKYLRNNSWDIIKKTIASVFLSFRINKIKEPLITIKLPLPIYIALCSSFVLYMSLGRHSGAMLWYFFQLLSPFLLAGAVWIFSRYAYWPFLCVPFLVWNLYIMTADQDYRLFDKNMTGWSQISMLISQHHIILNSPLIAPILIEQKKDVFDDGQAEYFLTGGDRTGWMKGLFKKDERVSMQLTLFFYNIRRMIENKEYDLIILQPSLLPLGVADDIRRYYKFEGQILLYAPADRRPYALTVWLPL